MEVRFYRNIISLMSASIISQVIVFASTPFLTNIYSPDNFGEVALFILYAGFFSSFISLRIEWSIPSATSSVHSTYLIFASVKIALYLSIIVFLFFLFDFDKYIFNFLGLKEVKFDFLIAPTSFLAVLVTVITTNFVRKNHMGRVSQSLVVQSLSNLVISLGIGLTNFVNVGLIISQFCSNLVALLYLLYKSPMLLRYAIVRKVKFNLLKRYKLQIASSSGVSLLNFFFQNSLPIILSINYTTREVGLFYLAMRIAGAPVSLISNGVANSFWGEVSNLVAKDFSKVRKFYLNTCLKLTLLSIPFMMMLFLLSENISWIFSNDEWRDLGPVILACTPLLIANLIFSPTTHLIVYNRQHYQLISDAISILLALSIVFLSSYFEWSFIETIFALSFVNLFAYIVRFFLHLRANTEAQTFIENKLSV